MKRTAKNERINEQTATKGRCERAVVGAKTTRTTDLSQALRRSTVALALTCGVCVCVSGCRSFLGADDERFRQGRGEYALNDEAVLRDWEQAARETGGTTRNSGAGENRQNGASEQNAGQDPASSRPILRSAALDEAESERRVSARKPVFGSPELGEEENDAPKSFGERVKGLFSLPKKAPRPSSAPQAPPASAVSRNSANSGKSENFARSGESKKATRAGGSGFSLGRGLPNVFSPSKRRGREKFPVDPVLQYDESRFMPSFQTCQQYYEPLAPRKSDERPLTSVETEKPEKATQRENSAQTVRTRQARATDARISGRELVAKSQKSRATTEAASGLATSGAASPKTSTTGWGKTRPISVAANEASANARPAVAPVGYLDVASKNETDFSDLTTRCDGFFGWEADDEALLNAISEPTGEVDESLTAYSAPSPTLVSAFPAVEPSAFASEVAEIATANGQNAQLGQDASTLTAFTSAQETARETAAPQDVVPTPAGVAPNGTVAEIGEVAATGGNGENAALASNSANAAALTAYAPSKRSRDASAPSDFASQLGETNFDWFDSRTKDSTGTPLSAEPSTVATLEPKTTLAPKTTSNVPSEAPGTTENEPLELISGEPRVDLDAVLANRLAPIASPSVSAVEAGEVASSLPVAPVPPVSAVEAGEVASSLPVAPVPPVSAVEVGEIASSLPVAPVPPVSAVEAGEVASSLPVAPIPPVSAVEVGEVASSLPVAPVPPVSAVEAGEVASSLPVAPIPPVSAVEAGEVASSLPVASIPPVSAVEAGEVASSLPVAPVPVAEVAQVLTPVAAETLDVEAPQALAAVENNDATGQENGVAGPNFALAAPGLDAGESIQSAVDERKDAAVAKPLSGDEIAWVEQIKSAIRTLVAERDAKKAAGEDVRRLDARLRLLYLAVDEYDRSIQEIQDDADPLKVFWETERGELETLLQSRLEEIDPTFVAERLRAGLDSLSGLCDLQIRKSALVVAPACFGLYEERGEAYKPGETVFAYAELEYVSCRETEEGRLIDVECRWRLLNADGSELTPVETQRCSNLSETKLRDVVLNVSAPLPNDLAPGTYLLETEVVDMNRPGAKPAKERLELTVVAGENAAQVEKAAE